jgi:hypothetical protein
LYPPIAEASTQVRNSGLATTIKAKNIGRGRTTANLNQKTVLRANGNSVTLLPQKLIK